MKIHLAVWDHSRGTDMSAHTTEEGAYKQCIQWARESLASGDWDGQCDGTEIEKMTDAELYANWAEITDFAENIIIEELPVHGTSDQQTCFDILVDALEPHVGDLER